MEEISSSNFFTVAQFENWLEDNKNRYFVDFVAKVFMILDVLDTDLKKISSDGSGELVRNRRIRSAKSDATDAIRNLL